MARSRGRIRRRSLLVGLLVAVTFTAGAFAFQTFASAATGQNGSEQTFSGVKCTAHVGSSTITQTENISVWITAPDSVAQGETFSVGIPSIAADLPSSSQGLTINNYKNLITKYKVSGGSVVSASGTTDGPATINGTSTPQQTDTSDPNFGPDIPGPIPPGHLVPANGTAQIAAPSADATITISAVEVDTTANVQSFGDVPVTCPVPANTLTSTQVGAGGPTTTSTTGASTTTTTKATTTTSTTVPTGGGGTAFTCTISGTTTFKPPLTETAVTTPKAKTVKVSTKATLTNCSGSPSGLKMPANNGTFTATASLKIPAGGQLPTCAKFEASNAALPLKWSSRLKNGTKGVASVKGPGTLGPITPDDPTTFGMYGSVTNRGAFNGKPLTIDAITNTSDSGLAATCSSAGGLSSLRFVSPSAYYLGPPPPPPTTTTTSTSTTTATSSTSTSTSTTTTMPTTTTTVNPVPPEVGQAIVAACNTLSMVVSPLGVDISPLTIACQAVADGQGSFLLQTFLISPQLGCIFLAGADANNPVVQAGCVAFAAAIAPYSSIIASLIPTGFF
jgi:hypothetical protein